MQTVLILSLGPALFFKSSPRYGNITLNPQLHSRSATYKRGMDF